MKKKNKYDTSVVLLYLIGKEDLLPAEFRKTIPSSTISDWRRTDYTSYIGHEYRYLFVDNSDYLLLKRKYEAATSALKSIIKAWICVQPLLLTFFKEARKNNSYQKQIVAAVGHLKKTIGLGTALKVFGISHTLFSIWCDVVRKNCKNSRISLCMIKYPRQLHYRETEKIRIMLTSPKWEHWPIVSIAALVLRSRKVIASLFTWYKYARIFNTKHVAVTSKKPKIGLQASTPNEYLHVDSTYYYLNETQKVCITFVMDNFSKMILGFAVHYELSFRVVKEALANSFKIVALHPDQKHPFLVADGGSENHNKEINEFIRNVSGFTITKIRALKDIRFSNSPVEAIHKIMKGRYLKNARFESIELLQSFIGTSMHDYNDLRPHYKHSPRTPSEVYFGTSLKFDPHERIMKAGKERLKKNKNSACSSCKGEALLGSCITTVKG